jgi:hypothetical protein
MTTAKYFSFRAATKFGAALFLLSTAAFSQADKKLLFRLQIVD